MRIYLSSIGVPMKYSCVPTYTRLAGLDKTGVHTLVDDPRDADVIAFTEMHLSASGWSFSRVRASYDFKKYREKCYVVDERDLPWCGLPGLYTSMPRASFRTEVQEPWCYHAVQPPQGRLNGDAPTMADADLLFSFMGSPSHACRRPLQVLKHPRSIVENVDGFVFFQPGSVDFAARRQRFAETLLRSKFVLCPRGQGASSIRFYETLAAGRVPVVIADQWVRPFSLPYEDFCVFWPEGSTEGLIEELERRESEAAAMGALASKIYHEHFAEDVMFHSFGEALSRLDARKPWEHFRRFGYPNDLLVKHQARAARNKVRAGLGARRSRA